MAREFVKRPPRQLPLLQREHLARHEAELLLPRPPEQLVLQKARLLPPRGVRRPVMPAHPAERWRSPVVRDAPLVREF